MSTAYPTPIEALISETEWPSITTSLSDLWPQFCDATRLYLATYPHRAKVADRLRVYLRLDSGSLYFAIAGASRPASYGDVGRIVIPKLELEWFALSRSDRDGFEQGHAALFRQVAIALESACSTCVCPLQVTIVEYDDLETEIALSAEPFYGL